MQGASSDELSPLLVVLDLDETLVYGTEQPLPRSADGRAGPYHIYKRPQVDEFVAQLLTFAKVAVWTSSTADYAAAILRLLFLDPDALAFAWSRERCIRRFDAELHDFYWVKDLTKLRRRGIDLSRVLVVDDSPRKLERNYGNLVRVKPFFGDLDDTELPRLLAYLRLLNQEPNLRKVEKRNWRTRF